jgi:hypothetical protein
VISLGLAETEQSENDGRGGRCGHRRSFIGTAVALLLGRFPARGRARPGNGRRQRGQRPDGNGFERLTVVSPGIAAVGGWSHLTVLPVAMLAGQSDEVTRTVNFLNWLITPVGYVQSEIL